MPLNNLRSMTALCRNFSTVSRHNSYSSRRNIYVKKGARLLTRLSGLAVGLGLGYMFVGDRATALEKDRQKKMNDYFWWYPFPMKEEDLTEKMWPELKELRENMKTRWSGLKDKMFSGRKSS